jgi:hypothetical protein
VATIGADRMADVYGQCFKAPTDEVFERAQCGALDDLFVRTLDVVERRIPSEAMVAIVMVGGAVLIRKPFYIRTYFSPGDGIVGDVARVPPSIRERFESAPMGKLGAMLSAAVSGPRYVRKLPPR